MHINAGRQTDGTSERERGRERGRERDTERERDKYRARKSQEIKARKATKSGYEYGFVL